MGKHSKIVFSLPLLLIAVGLEAVPPLHHPPEPGTAPKKDNDAAAAPKKKSPDTAVELQFMIPAENEEEERDKRFWAFVEITIRTPSSSDHHNFQPVPETNKQYGYGSVLRYVPPLSGGGNHLRESGPDPITTTLTKHIEDNMLSTGFTFHLASSSQGHHTEDHGEREMGLRLLAELLYCPKFHKPYQRGQRMDSMHITLEGRLSSSGVSTQLPRAIGGHFRLALFNEKGEFHGSVELFPGPVDVVHKVGVNVEKLDMLKVRLQIDAKYVTNTAASSGAKATKEVDGSVKKSPSHLPDTSPPHKKGGGG